MLEGREETGDHANVQDGEAVWDIPARADDCLWLWRRGPGAPIQSPCGSDMSAEMSLPSDCMNFNVAASTVSHCEARM